MDKVTKNGDEKVDGVTQLEMKGLKMRRNEMDDLMAFDGKEEGTWIYFSLSKRND